MKTFNNIKPNYIKGVGWWFWTRESFAVLNRAINEIWEDTRNDPGQVCDLRLWFAITIVAPCLYCLVPTIGAYIRNQYVKNRINEGNSFNICNKNNIEYFTILEMLGGNND